MEKTTFIFEKCLGGSGDTELLFVVNCSSNNDAQHIEYKFKEAGHDDIIYREVPFFASISDLRAALVAQKLSRIKEIEDASEFKEVIYNLL